MSSNLVWSIKNGDAENVKELFEKEVGLCWANMSDYLWIFVLKIFHYCRNWMPTKWLMVAVQFIMLPIMDKMKSSSISFNKEPMLMYVDVILNFHIETNMLIFDKLITDIFFSNRHWTSTVSVHFWLPFGKATLTVYDCWSRKVPKLTVALPMDWATSKLPTKMKLNHFSVLHESNSTIGSNNNTNNKWRRYPTLISWTSKIRSKQKCQPNSSPTI